MSAQTLDRSIDPAARRVPPMGGFNLTVLGIELRRMLRNRRTIVFTLILPAALFRLCGGRVENLGDLQPLAVKAGINGVMMGNFLTTLGNTPDEDRAMFTELGLNVARQADNGANPRPDNRSGWLDGETPDVVEEYLDTRADAESAGIEVKLWDPATQLRFARKSTVPPRPDGAPNAWPQEAA